MNRILTALLLIVLPHWLAVADEAEFEFRNDERPGYEKGVSVDEVESLPAGTRVVDVRLPEDFEADPVLVPGATYRDPERIALWTKDMSPADGPVVVYCVAGKWVSQKAATYLSEQGFDVYTLEGGINAWKDSGRDVESPGSQR